ncbi:MCE family protein [Thermoleophilia bacterium SCSIO 60948]|nr:MCE family protein [Thermoleophilia bacterium SCSIO 60948]
MNKQAPSIGRILIAIGFILSCFGLILFLWIAFGGPIPLKAKSYRVTAYFPEATQLAPESDVRIGGVSVGKVKEVELAPIDQRVNGKDTTQAVIEIDPEFAPISTNAEAILRQKTLLGETFVELTSGSNTELADNVSMGAAATASDTDPPEDLEPIEEGGTLGIGQTTEATQIDEIFNALDTETRTSFQNWIQSSAVAIDGREQDLNDALGNIGPFASDASDVLAILRRQQASLKGLVRDSGTVFEAATAYDDSLTTAISGTNDVFDALASQDAALAETFQILPTFNRELRLTLIRLDEFQRDTHPLVRDLIPVARQLSPTLASVRQLSPNLRSLFPDLDRLITVSENGLPALSKVVRGFGPVFKSLDPFLANLNPIVEFLEYNKRTFADFFSSPAAALSNSLPTLPGQDAKRSYLRQIAYTSPEVLGILPERLETNRGNAYPKPDSINNRDAATFGIPDQFDCKPSGGEIAIANPPEGDATEIPGPGYAPCQIGGNFPGEFGGLRFPGLTEDP